jgi:hypothetical protein
MEDTPCDLNDHNVKSAGCDLTGARDHCLALLAAPGFAQSDLKRAIGCPNLSLCSSVGVRSCLSLVAAHRITQVVISRFREQEMLRRSRRRQATLLRWQSCQWPSKVRTRGQRKVRTCGHVGPFGRSTSKTECAEKPVQARWGPSSTWETRAPSPIRWGRLFATVRPRSP